jgi:hypothetical protein
MLLKEMKYVHCFSAPGRKKKVVEEVKPAPELSHSAQVSTLPTKSSTSAQLSTSVDTIDQLVSSPVIEQLTLAVKTKHESPLIPAGQSSSVTPAELHAPSSPFEPPIVPPYATEHPSSTDSLKASPPVCIISESAEGNSLATSTEMLSTPGPSSPCRTPSVSTVQVFEEETRMSAESGSNIGSRSQTPAHALPPAGMGPLCVVFTITK